ncbi:MAG: cohesin domain-containing protein [Patescibacteria group bacterium]
MRKVALLVLFSAIPLIAVAQQLGASLYISPLSSNPRAASNFTVTIKADSLGEPVNAVKGTLTFPRDRLEIIGISKIGSILNLWVEEPRFSNINGTLKFQGGVPNPGFMGSGGTVLHVIFRAKLAGATSLIWKDGEVLANDGKGTNILIDLQNLDFFTDEAFAAQAPSPAPMHWWENFLIIINIIFLAIILLIGLVFLEKAILNYHDRHSHHKTDDDLDSSNHIHRNNTERRDSWDESVLGTDKHDYDQTIKK